MDSILSFDTGVALEQMKFMACGEGLTAPDTMVNDAGQRKFREGMR